MFEQDFIPHSKTSLFIAVVQSVRLQPELDTQSKIVYGAGTIDVKPIGGRMGLKGVRVMVPNTAQVNGSSRGFFWLPSIGDWVVCGYLESYPDHPVCMGSIYNPTYSNPPEAALSDNGQSYQMYDLVMQHQTGSYIRFRNNNQPYQDSRGSWHDPKTNLSEIVIHHNAGDELLINEATAGKTEFTYTHNTGTQIKISSNGSITVTGTNAVNVNATNAVTINSSGSKITLQPGSGSTLELGSGAGEQLVLGNTFMSLFNAHIHPTGVGPSGAPTSPMSTNHLATNAKVKANW